MRAVKQFLSFLAYFLQAPVALMLFVAGLYWFTDGVSGLSHGKTPSENDNGLFFLVLGGAVCYFSFRLLTSAFSNPDGENR
jgi:hypothetical protein